MRVISPQARGDGGPRRGRHTVKERTTMQVVSGPLVSVFRETSSNKCSGSRPWLWGESKHIIFSGIERAGHRKTLPSMWVLDSIQKAWEILAFRKRAGQRMQFISQMCNPQTEQGADALSSSRDAQLVQPGAVETQEHLSEVCTTLSCNESWAIYKYLGALLPLWECMRITCPH